MQIANIKIGQDANTQAEDGKTRRLDERKKGRTYERKEKERNEERKTDKTLGMKNAVFRDVTPCGSCTDDSEERVASIFNGRDMFLRNVSSNKTHTSPHPRRRHSS
jgi:hypothetical protein